MATFAERFKHQRDNVKRWTQDQAAEALGVSRSTIAGYESEEKNRIPREETLNKIADLFDVSIDYLLGRTDDPTPQPKKEIPDWASSRDKRDLKKFLEQQEVMFDGAPMSEEDKEKVIRFMEFNFWEAKQMNKRKKKTDEE